MPARLARVESAAGVADTGAYCRLGHDAAYVLGPARLGLRRRSFVSGRLSVQIQPANGVSSQNDEGKDA